MGTFLWGEGGVCIRHKYKSKQGASNKDPPKLREKLEWAMETVIINKTFHVYGPPKIDLFITRIDAQVSLFIILTRMKLRLVLSCFSLLKSKKWTILGIENPLLKCNSCFYFHTFHTDWKIYQTFQNITW